MTQIAIASPSGPVSTSSPGAAGGVYRDLDQIIWKYKDWDTSLVIEGNGERIMTGHTYVYTTTLQGGVQYGNLTKVVDKVWDDSAYAWDAYRMTLTRFYPKNDPANGKYLVGLPAFTNTYACPAGPGDEISCRNNYVTADLQASSWNLYDDATMVGTLITTFGNAYHEVYQPIFSSVKGSTQDFFLTWTGIALGNSFGRGFIPRSDLGNVFRRTLGGY